MLEFGNASEEVFAFQVQIINTVKMFLEQSDNKYCFITSVPTFIWILEWIVFLKVQTNLWIMDIN